MVFSSVSLQDFVKNNIKPSIFDQLPNTTSENVYISGTNGAFDICYVAHLFWEKQQTILIVTADSKQCDSYERQIKSIVGDEFCCRVPTRDAVPYNLKSPFGPTIEDRFTALSHLIKGKKKIYIAPVSALIQKVPHPRSLFNSVIRLQLNDEVTQDTLIKWLVDNGFTRETAVDNIGTFAVRGGIFDIYPFLCENPIRIEFWGDTIDSIREFDIFKQHSRKSLSSIEIYPMKEFVVTRDEVTEALERIEEFCDDIDKYHNHFDKIKHKWVAQQDHDGLEWFIHWFDKKTASLLDYFPPDSTIVYNDRLTLEHYLSHDVENYERHYDRVADVFKHFITEPSKLLIPNRTVQEDLQCFNRVNINSEFTHGEDYSPVKVLISEQPSFNYNVQFFIRDIKEKLTDGYTVAIVSENKGRAERLFELLEDVADRVVIVIGTIDSGFVDSSNKFVMYAESTMVQQRRNVRVSRRVQKESTPIADFAALNSGDFVVHVDYGIAKFVGIERISTGSTVQDCMVLIYQENSKVYVPLDDFHKVQKYIGKDSNAPTLSKIGTSRWEKQKAKTREAVQEMARELIELYAKRQYLEGIQFKSDVVWQKEFEDSFMYDETPDQLSAVKEIKKDMESPKPMDRLVCGDVGFGKTEVAIRAAFKAVMAGYQVAVLAPTTVLASQHYSTFKERMGNFPVSLGLLSRFVKAADQKKVFTGVSEGKIDIVIGTHRILSKDLHYKNLGLIVVDEEQRFGVKHKEKLKEFRFKVDVLSMTATPIPRTLHMSMLGIRDLSIINTPPQNRLPIETKVMEYHDDILKTAVENEMERGGQVYVVHNRIESLYLLQERIELAVPKARTIIGHGQMEEKQLDLVMREFIAGKYDVLIATTIIETGIDISNVNTILVNRADTLGLSQLYQLRGRVGRSAEQAYAYFLTPPFKNLNNISLKRLKALEQYTELGSGFQIAMRDLEIRGAGNILGTSQHGSIATVGFDLYCKILKEEIDSIRGVSDEDPIKPIKLTIPIDSYIPNDYISDPSTRISLYQECSSYTEIEDVITMHKGFADRFGPLPEPVEVLMMYMKIKIYGQKLKLSQLILEKSGKLILSLHEDSDDVPKRIKSFLDSAQSEYAIEYGEPVKLVTHLSTFKPLERLTEIETILKKHVDAIGVVKKESAK